MDKIIEDYDVIASKKHFLITCSLQNLNEFKSQFGSNLGNIDCI